jgi:lysozyme
MRKLTLRFNDPKNEEAKHKKQIAELNQRLVWWGVLDPLYAKDDNFSNKTLEAVCDFQEKKSLTIDGVVGTNTWQELTKQSDSEVVEVISQCGVNGCSIEPPEHEDLTAGVNIIKYWEGLRLSVYVCPAGVLTVGYGATRTLDGKPWVMGQKITKQLAEDLLQIQIAEVFLPKLRKIPHWFEMNNNQRSAILSFAYNLGENFYDSNGFGTISKVLKNKEWAQVPKALMLYVNPGSSFEKGLRARRQQEGQLWSKPI